MKSSRDRAPTYRSLDAKELKKHASQRGGSFDGIVKSEFTEYRPQENENRVRIIRPSKDASYWGEEIQVHYNVGPDNQSYICLRSIGEKRCPICDERRKHQGRDAEYVASLQPSKRYLVWVIDRSKESEGPKVWSMPQKVDTEFAALAVDEDGAVINIDHPESGFDVIFSRKGKDQRTQYGGFKLARRSTPLSDDEDTQADWLAYVQKHPPLETLQNYSYEYIEAIFSGGESGDTNDRPSKRTADPDEDGEQGTRRRRESSDDDSSETDPDEDRPARRRRGSSEEEAVEDAEAESEPRKRTRDAEPDEESDDPEPEPRRRSRSTTKQEEEDPEVDPEEEDDRPKRRAARKEEPEEDPEEEPEEDTKPKGSRLKERLRSRR